MHRAGTWTGSESFVFAGSNREISASLQKRIKYFNWFSGLQILSRIDYVDGGFSLPVRLSFAEQAAASRPPFARQDPATTHPPDRRAGPEMTAARGQTRPAMGPPLAAAPTRP